MFSRMAGFAAMTSLIAWGLPTHAGSLVQMPQVADQPAATAAPLTPNENGFRIQQNEDGGLLSSVALVSQSGFLNTADIIQAGGGNFGQIVQTGLANSASIHQTGLNHRASIFQSGSNNMARVVQR